MNMNCPFNSRESEYKSIFGAAAAGEGVFLRVLLPRDIHCSGVCLVTELDGSKKKEYAGMFWAGMCDYTHEWWDITFTPSVPGLYWYYFECQTPQGKRRIMQSKQHGGVGVFSEDGRAFQQTVYDPNFKTPEWFRGGIMYQIFPDRFAFSGKEKENIPSGRILRGDWGGVPEYRQTKDKKILNNDYFGGDLAGIIQKLDRLEELGVTCIYLNPIFEAHSNHRYDTADYLKIDPLLGNEEDLTELCREAEKRGMSVILDGVFSHTGCDSVYFNKYGRYSQIGAYNSKESPYYSWYSFQNWPDKYSSWWGIKILPEVKEDDPQYLDFITGENGVLRKWLRAGIKGWRLDVADELPDVFLDALRKAVKEENSDAVIIGEVWEDASNKISYGYRRRYLLGEQLDSVMNYPFANAILDFIKGAPASRFLDTVSGVIENYPPQVVHCLMNHIGTHDTERALTYIAGEPANGRPREWQSEQSLTREQYAHGVKLLKLAAALQYFLPGIPSVYYGDEAGMQGYRDPFNRGCYPWGNENTQLLEWYKSLGKIRRACPTLKDGGFRCLSASEGLIVFERFKENDSVLCAVNREGIYKSVKLGKEWIGSKVLLGNGPDISTLSLPPYSCAVLGRGEWTKVLKG